MAERKPVYLDIEYILKDNFLIADLFLQDELREKLEKGVYPDFQALKNHFANEENVKSLASIFKAGLYDEHMKNKRGNHTYSIVKDATIGIAGELSGLGLLEIAFKGVKQLWKEKGSDAEVAKFVEEVQKLSDDSLDSVVVGGVERDYWLYPGQKDLAKRLVQAGVDISVIDQLELFTQEELEDIKNSK
ncbi:hypothetical protein SAMN04487777_11726 [Priestia aryabhattai B8W22]|uniref:hypothetical protein n=1 Tax=Priestia aryabhattai TaxID=412384 RepID=UPI00087F861F|nr:hypothetical protein SAMN04487777_11726 [Priestia aryabhattai B8W22]